MADILCTSNASCNVCGDVEVEGVTKEQTEGNPRGKDAENALVRAVLCTFFQPREGFRAAFLLAHSPTGTVYGENQCRKKKISAAYTVPPA